MNIWSTQYGCLLNVLRSCLILIDINMIECRIVSYLKNLYNLINYTMPKAPKSDYKRELIPSGKHETTIYSIVDLWTQWVEWDGEKKLQRKIMITWEFHEIKKEYEWEEKPVAKGKKYTFSMNDRSKLKELITNIYGSDQWEDFDVNDLMGKKCEIKIIHKKHSSGNEYEDFAYVGDSDHKFDLFNDKQKFYLDEYSENDFDTLKERQQDIIKESPEYKNILNKEDESEKDSIDDDLWF